MTNDNFSLLLVGCGKMGSAMLQSWRNLSHITHIDVLDPQATEENTSSIHTYPDIKTLQKSENCKNWDVVILAIKPQILEDACKQITPLLSKKQLVISIAAGKQLSSIEKHFTSEQPLIRCMPNTPTAIGKGMSAAFANQYSTSRHQEITNALLSPLGKLIWVEKEELLDPVTALSGSGPAYVFYLIESLAKAGEHIGLDAETSKTLARQTVIGSAALTETEVATSPEQLRINVTSPGGTTQAALDVIMDGRMQELWNEALSAATSRAKELNK